MPLFLSGSNGVSGADGTAALPAVQGTDGNTGVFFPAADQVAIATNGTQRLLVDSAGVITASAGNVLLVSGTAQASTSGTNIDFTGIPSWVRRITVMLNNVSTNGTNSILVQLGTSSGITASGYTGSLITFGPAFTAFSTGFLIAPTAAVRSHVGQVFITNISGNAWVESSSLARQDAADNAMSAGAVTLAGTLDRVRVTTVGGTDAFDAGSINILYE